MNTPVMMQEVVVAHDRLTEDELANLGIVLGAYRSFRGNRRAHIAYVSMPITSGRRLYDVLSEENVQTVEELIAKCGKNVLWERVIQLNIAEGIALADTLGKREDLLFIAPSVFEAKRWRWTQDAYMSLWYRVIGEMAGKLVVMDGWEYSNGGVDEVLFALYLRWRVFRMSNLKDGVQQFNLKNFLPNMSREDLLRELEAMWKMQIFDADGDEIHLDVALMKCTNAIYELRDRNLPYNTLLEKAYKMMLIPFFTPSFYEPEKNGDSVINSSHYKDSRERIKALLH